MSHPEVASGLVVSGPQPSQGMESSKSLQVDKGTHGKEHAYGTLPQGPVSPGIVLTAEAEGEESMDGEGGKNKHYQENDASRAMCVALGSQR